MAMYFEDFVFDEESRETFVSIFDWNTGKEVDYKTFKPENGDELKLIEIPFDKEGYHATGWAVYDSRYMGDPWRPEYETENGREVI